MVHGDVRWDNCSPSRRGSRRWTKLELIDWELCESGDPAVDVGAFLGEYLRAWVAVDPDRRPPRSGPLRARRVPLRRMRPAVGAFWRPMPATGGFAGGAGRDAPAVVRFAAVRLLMAAFEEAQALGELRPGVLALLPLSQNVLRRPDEAAELLELA